MPGDRFIELAMQEDRHVLDVLFKHASEGITVQDAVGRLVYANDPAARLIGFGSAEELLNTPAADLVGRFEIIDQSGSILSFDRLPGRRVINGESVAEEVVGYRRPGGHRVRWSRVNASPIKNDAGEVVLAVNFFMDITEQIRDQDTRKLLSIANEVLGSSIDLEENLKALANLIVPQLGSWCGVHLQGDDGALTSVIMIHPATADAEMLVQMTQGERISIDSESLSARVVRSNEHILVPAITREMLDDAKKRAAETRGSTELIDLVERLELNSIVCVPLRMGSHVIGALTVARSGPDLPFDDNDVQVLVTVAERAAVTLENARLYQHEREVSQLLQRGLMPRFLPDFEGLEIAARYRPLSRIGHVGGDFYDVIPLSADLCVLVVGDIEGKGTAAAAAVGLARHTIRAIVNVDPTPAVVMSALNRALLEEEQRMCTLAYVLLDRHGDRFEMRVSLAGHPPPIHISRDGTVTQLGTPCPPAGVLPSIEPIEESYWLEAGDRLLIYTDGFAFSDLAPPESVEIALGEARSEDLEELLDRLLAHLEATSTPNVPDDVAFLAARISPST